MAVLQAVTPNNFTENNRNICGEKIFRTNVNIITRPNVGPALAAKIYYRTSLFYYIFANSLSVSSVYVVLFHTIR